MARRVERVTISGTNGRDETNVYVLTEMSASQAEAWATRLLLALGKSGIEVEEGVFRMGMAGIAAMGVKAMGHLPWEVAKPLMDEMFECVQIAPDKKNPQVVRPLNPNGSDIEEVATRLLLRDEVIRLHMGFSVRDFLSNLRKLGQELAEEATERALGPNTETSPTSSPE